MQEKRGPQGNPRKKNVPIVIFRIAMGFALMAIVVWLFLPTSKKVIEVDDFSNPTEASVRAPFFPLSSGMNYVLYDGELNFDSKLTVVSNHGRDRHEILLKAGRVYGVHGGPEEWVDDLSVTFTPVEGELGTIKVGLYCGSRFSKRDQEWFERLYQLQRERN